MNTLTGSLLVLILALPLLSMATIASLATNSLRSARISGALNALAFLLAAALLVLVSVRGSVSVTAVPIDGGMIGFHADRIVGVLLMLVTGVSAVVQAFAGRYLHGDLRAKRFFVGANLLTAATAAMVASATLIGLATAWTASGLALLVLLGMYPGLASADLGFRRTGRAFLIGDLALWCGVLIATLEWGNLSLANLDEAGLTDGNGSAILTVVACLLVVAALSRSAQVPFQKWLPSTLAVPTPVSALLHAGVVNAGGILLVRTSPLFGESAMATHLAFFAGAATAAYGTALMISKPDVKGALAHSTTGQMGFMIMTCGLGAWAAAIFHLVAHGMYKASLFLGSGSAVNRRSRNLQAPPPPPGTARAGTKRIAAFSILVPAVVVLISAATLYPDITPATGALLIFAWATAAWATRGWLARRSGFSGLMTATAAVCLAVPAYVLALSLATAFLNPELVSAGEATVSPWWLAAFLPALWLARPTGKSSGPVSEFRKNAYVSALGASQVRPSQPGWTSRFRIPSPAPVGGLATESQGVRT